MNTVTQKLIALADEKNAAFQKRLTPVIFEQEFLGVRVPNVRKLAKEIAGTPECEAFLSALPHRYFDENMLHAILLGHEKDFDKCMKQTEAFLPYIDNWAVCDSLRPACCKKHLDAFLPMVKKWIAGKEPFTCRFGIEMLLIYYSGKAFQADLLELPAQVQNEDYYVRMMIAWFYADQLIKHWEDALPYLENRRLSEWTHKKTVQKARESFRITPEQKEYLRKC